MSGTSIVSMLHLYPYQLTIVTQYLRPKPYIDLRELDADLEMFTKDEAASDWRQLLSAGDLQRHPIGASVGDFVNNNKIQLNKLMDNRKDAFAEEKVLASKLISKTDDTLMNARHALNILPYSTLMREEPKRARSELSRWIQIYVEAIEVQSHLKTRMEAAASGYYWRPITPNSKSYRY